jgi:arylsulfatase
VPTILEAAGITAPVMVNGVAQKPIEGVSMDYTWDPANATAKSHRTTQYFEMFGARALYHDGWIAATPPPAPPWMMGTAAMPNVVTGYKWELYNLDEDYSEANNVADKYPEKLKELQDYFWMEAAKYQVFPLDNSILTRLITPRPSTTAGRNEFVYAGVMPGIPTGSAPSFLNRSYTITAEVEIPKGGGNGMLATLGGRFGGFGFYMLKGKPVFLYNALDLKRFRWEGPSVLAPGKHTLTFAFTYDGPGFGKGGTGVLSVDGKTVSTQSMPHSIPFIMAIDESFDVGTDTRTSVADTDYQPPFTFNGTLSKLTVTLQPPQIASGESTDANHKLARAAD